MNVESYCDGAKVSKETQCYCWTPKFTAFSAFSGSSGRKPPERSRRAGRPRALTRYQFIAIATIGAARGRRRHDWRGVTLVSSSVAAGGGGGRHSLPCKRASNHRNCTTIPVPTNSAARNFSSNAPMSCTQRILEPKGARCLKLARLLLMYIYIYMYVSNCIL